MAKELGILGAEMGVHPNSDGAAEIYQNALSYGGQTPKYMDGALQNAVHQRIRGSDGYLRRTR